MEKRKDEKVKNTLARRDLRQKERIKSVKRKRMPGKELPIFGLLRPSEERRKKSAHSKLKPTEKSQTCLLVLKISSMLQTCQPKSEARFWVITLLKPYQIHIGCSNLGLKVNIGCSNNPHVRLPFLRSANGSEQAIFEHS